MNARSLLIVLVILGGMCIALTSKSTLTPQRGGDHVFYGAELNHFISQEATIGNFNGDIYDDIVTTILWHNPECGGYDLKKNNPTATICNTFGWKRFLAENAGDTLSVCLFPDPDAHEEHWSYWACLGWDSISGSATSCDTCYTAEFRGEDQGAALVFLGGDWSDKDHDIDLSLGGENHMILGRVPGGRIYNAMAAGDMDDDGKTELILGAPAAGAGEVYVIRGSNAWPDTIDLSDPGDFDNWVLHYIKGRDSGDGFGLGVATGDLDYDVDNLADLVVAAPFADSYTGEVFVFYAAAGLPDTIDLAQLDDNDIGGYGQVIYGNVPGDSVGVTNLRNTHPPHHGLGEHPGQYNPAGFAIGDWDNDGVNDLAIGGGQVGTRVGAAYVIFGAGTPVKLTPGNTVDLANTPGTSASACDIRVDGNGAMALGGGLGFVDADAGTTGDDLLIGAPTASRDGKLQRGSVYIVFGDTRNNLLTIGGTGGRVRSVNTSGHTDKKIVGEDANDQLGGHFSGARNLFSSTLDIDDDGDNDIGIAGQKEMTVIFGQPQGAWEDVIDLASVLQDYPDMRIVEFQPEQYARSTTILFADLDGDDNHDLVFGGYDSPGHSPGDPTGDTGAMHAGQMWVTKGSDLWKTGTVTANTTWSGNIFVHGDIVVDNGATLTIAAGTDVWMWPKDPGPNLGNHEDFTEIVVEDGSLVIQGTSMAKVRLQAWTMDGAVSASGQEWSGIWIDEDGTATIEYAIIRNAYQAIGCRADLTLKNSLIEDCDYLGISVGGDSTNVDSVYVQYTTIQNLQDEEAIGVNVLGDGAVVRLDNCTIDGCETGIAAYTEARLYTSATTVRNCTVYGVRANGDSYVSMVNSTVEDVAVAALRAYDGSLVWTGNCTFQTSDRGVDVSAGGGDDPYVTLYQGHLLENGVGLYVSGTDDVSLTLGEASENEDEGVYCLSGADIVVSFSDLTDNTVGVRCDNSDPLITDNYIGENNGGIACQNYAYPTVEANKVWNNNNGISFVDDADADMDACGGSCPPCADGNSFKGNSGFHFSNLTSTTISATCNYWGKTTPAPAKFYGPVNYTPYLGSDPLPVADLPGPRPDEKLPNVYSLTGNAPNPFNPVTTIRYEVPPPGGRVSLRVFNVRGQLVSVLVNDHVGPGIHNVTWNGVDQRGSEVASGVYFLQMTAPHFQAARKIVMLK